MSGSVPPGGPTSGGTDRAPPARGRRISKRVLAILIVLILVVSISVPLAVEKLRTKPSPWGPSAVPIKHIVVLMMENHAYDNMFGTYCQAVGPECPMSANGIPSGT
ncbi:MAG: hypothetical protein L3J86_06395, partial [Thermoplasmata archaeon]|nr:hypothetical protein [Thermoplasmata archaeon]